MNLFKHEYENILQLLKRVEIRGLEEAKEVAKIGLKIEAKVANWIDGAEVNKAAPAATPVARPLSEEAKKL